MTSSTNIASSKKIGEGGMGVVYRACDTRLNRDVALKFITRAAAGGAAHSERLHREARALAALNHPNIITIHDIGESEGRSYLVLEWVAGGRAAPITSRLMPRSLRDRPPP